MVLFNAHPIAPPLMLLPEEEDDEEEPPDEVPPDGKFACSRQNGSCWSLSLFGDKG